MQLIASVSWALLVSFVLRLRVVSSAPGPSSLIIDTDVGSYYDDFMAIALVLKNDDFDVKLVVTCTDDTTARARVVAKFLTLLGRSDIPIGIGVKNGNSTEHSLFGWGADFDLDKYGGCVYQDGVAAMATVLEQSAAEVEILAIGPATNFPSLISRYPGALNRAKVVLSGGSIYKGYYNTTPAVAEYNIAMCPLCARQLLATAVSISVAPLDTTGVGSLTADYTRQLLASVTADALSVGNSLVYYCSNHPYDGQHPQCEFNVSTPVFFDAVAALMTFRNGSAFLEYRELNIAIDDFGYTLIDAVSGVPVTVALYWVGGDAVGLDKYRAFLASALSSRVA